MSANERFPSSLLPLLVDVSSLTLDPANARKHPERNIETIKGSLARFGQQKPIVVDEAGVVIAGNGTLQAARLLGWDRIAAVRSPLVGSDRTAFGIADNKTAELAEWDEDALNALVASLGDDAEALAATGFDATELAEMRKVEPQSDPDEVPEPPVVALTQPGDLIVLGNHRLLCGDSTKAEDVARLMDGQRAVLMNTDPPYGVDYGALVASRKNQKKGGWADIENDALSDDDLSAMLTAALDGCGALAAFVWHPPGARRFLFWRALESNGWRIAQEIVWVKNALVFGRSDYQWRHEPCLYAKRPGAAFQDDRTQTTVWEFPKPTASEHPTQKPVELFSVPIRNHTAPGAVCYDPFLGSGTTLIAAEQLNRRCFGMEIEPRYCDVIVRRWQTFTGRKADGWRGNE